MLAPCRVEHAAGTSGQPTQVVTLPLTTVDSPCAMCRPAERRPDRPHFSLLWCTAKSDRASGVMLRTRAVAILHLCRKPLECRRCRLLRLNHKQLVLNVYYAYRGPQYQLLCCVARPEAQGKGMLSACHLTRRPRPSLETAMLHCERARRGGGSSKRRLRLPPLHPLGSHSFRAASAPDRSVPARR